MMWTSVGSDGTVNIPDINKVVFEGAVVQLGAGGPVGPPIANRTTGEKLPLPQTTSAVLRYPVSAADMGGVPSGGGEVEMKVRYRDGAGKILVQLLQVSVATGAETAILGLESGSAGGYPTSNNFHVESNVNTDFPVLDFTNNVFYVALTLTGPQGPEVTTPPAVDTIQILPAQLV